MKSLSSLVTAATLLAATSASADAVISTRVIQPGPGPYSPGTTLTLEIRATTNTSVAPTVFAFRMTYNAQSLKFLDASPAWAGSVLNGPVTPPGNTPPGKYVDIVGFSFGNAARTPTFANVRFVVGNFTGSGVPASPFGVTVSDNPNTSLTLADNSDKIIPHTFENDATSNLIISDAADLDGDGLSDKAEATAGTNPAKIDTDGDGIDDSVEVIIGSNPLVPESFKDTDHDGLPDANDPNPNNPDTDGDGYRDGYEVAFGTDPSLSSSRPSLGDVNGDSKLDTLDAVLMARVFLGLDPESRIVIPQAFDVNRDGFRDNLDAMIIFNLFLGNLPFIPLLSR